MGEIHAEFRIVRPGGERSPDGCLRLDALLLRPQDNDQVAVRRYRGGDLGDGAQVAALRFRPIARQLRGIGADEYGRRIVYVATRLPPRSSPARRSRRSSSMETGSLGPPAPTALRVGFGALTAKGANLPRRAGSRSRTRTCDKSVNSRLLYQLSYPGSGRRGPGIYVGPSSRASVAAPRPKTPR